MVGSKDLLRDLDRVDRGVRDPENLVFGEKGPKPQNWLRAGISPRHDPAGGDEYASRMFFGGKVGAYQNTREQVWRQL